MGRIPEYPNFYGAGILDTAALNELITRVNALSPNLEQINVTTYTLGLDDTSAYIQSLSDSAVTITVPPDTDVPFANGTQIVFEQTGLGTVAVDPGAGVTINSYNGASGTIGQFAQAVIVKTAPNTWTLSGNIS